MSAATETCPDCDGAGWVTVNPSQSWPRNPQLDREVPCKECMGAGEREPDDPADEIPERIAVHVSREDFANPRPPGLPDEEAPF